MCTTYGPKAKNCYRLRVLLSNLSLGFAGFPELLCDVVGMLDCFLAADSSNDPLSRVL